MNLSVIIPVYNEEKSLQNLIKLHNYLNGKFEILVCDNGSTDNSATVIRGFKYPKIKYVKVPERGLGLGIKAGIENAKYDNIMFYAIDLPFGLNIIDESLTALKKYDIVIGSKGHKKSINRHSLKRKVFSFIFNCIINIRFGLDVKDSQGSLMFKRKNVRKFLKKLNAKDAFLETQILIYGKQQGNSIVEIPVVYRPQTRQSKMRPVRDGLTMFKQIIREK